MPRICHLSLYGRARVKKTPYIRISRYANVSSSYIHSLSLLRVFGRRWVGWEHVDTTISGGILASHVAY